MCEAFAVPETNKSEREEKDQPFSQFLSLSSYSLSSFSHNTEEVFSATAAKGRRMTMGENPKKKNSGNRYINIYIFILQRGERERV